MGKMIDAQSIVVASTATKWYGHEGTILRRVLPHSPALAVLVGVLIYCQAYVPPFTLLSENDLTTNGGAARPPPQAAVAS
jgi:lactate permease